MSDQTSQPALQRAPGCPFLKWMSGVLSGIQKTARRVAWGLKNGR